MKKTWKKILCSLMLAPCMFWATACGDPEDPDNSTTDLTVEQQQEAYTTLRTLASTLLDNDGSKDQVYKLENGRWTNKIYDFTDSGLTGFALDEAMSLTNNIDNTINSKTSYVGYKSNNTGYNLVSVEEKGTEDEESTTTTVSNITKYNGQKYVNYTNDGTNKVAAYVSNSHAKNEYLLEPEDLNMGLDNEFIEELLEIVDDGENFDGFKETLQRWAFRLMTRLQVFGGTDEDLDNFIDNEMQDLTATYKLSLVEGDYILSLDTSAHIEDRISYPLEHIADSYFRSNVDVVFNNDRIKSINIDYNNGIITEFTCKSYWNSDIFAGYEFLDTDVMRCDSTYKERAYIEFETEFDNNFFNQDVSDYVGTGTSGEIENRLSNITIVCNDVCEEVKAPYGVDLWETVSNALVNYTSGTNLQVVDIYIESNDGLTNLFKDSLVPSYDITVYVTIEEPPVEKISTDITINITNTGVEEVCSFFVGDNLYDTFKAVWGLADGELLGIYSDSRLENKLSADTLITEGMTIYVVLEAGWSPIPPETN